MAGFVVLSVKGFVHSFMKNLLSFLFLVSPGTKMKAEPSRLEEEAAEVAAGGCDRGARARA